jgi:hypothetical protein
LYFGGVTYALQHPYECDPSIQYCRQVINAGNLDDGYVGRFNISPSVSIEEALAESASFIVYPNPSAGAFTIAFDAEQGADVTVAVFDISGRLLKNSPLGKKYGIVEHNISLSDFSEGVYFIQLSLNGNISAQQVVKH